MLLIAAVMAALFCFVPFASMPAEAEGLAASSIFAKDAPALLILNIAIAALLLIIIFMYKNLRMQMRMTVLSIVLICASMVTSGFFIAVGFEGATPVLFGGIALLVLALIFALLALRGMRHDRKLLSSMDRLR